MKQHHLQEYWVEFADIPVRINATVLRLTVRYPYDPFTAMLRTMLQAESDMGTNYP